MKLQHPLIYWHKGTPYISTVELYYNLGEPFGRYSLWIKFKMKYRGRENQEWIEYKPCESIWDKEDKVRSRLKELGKTESEVPDIRQMVRGRQIQNYLVTLPYAYALCTLSTKMKALRYRDLIPVGK